jgi:hypothetical protein
MSKAHLKPRRLTLLIRIISVLLILLLAATELISKISDSPAHGQWGYTTFITFGLYIILGVINAVLFLFLLTAKEKGPDRLTISLVAINIAVIVLIIIKAW